MIEFAALRAKHSYLTKISDKGKRAKGTKSVS